MIIYDASMYQEKEIPLNPLNVVKSMDFGKMNKQKPILNNQKILITGSSSETPPLTFREKPNLNDIERFN